MINVVIHLKSYIMVSIFFTSTSDIYLFYSHFFTSILDIYLFYIYINRLNKKIGCNVIRAGGDTERIPSSIKSPEKTPVEPQQHDHDEPIEKEAQPPRSKWLCCCSCWPFRS